MRQVDFEYCRKHAPSWPGKAMCALGFVAVAAVSITYFHWSDDAARWEEATQKLQPPVSASAEADPAQLQQKIDEANTIARRLSIPWGQLLKGMEGAASDQVALLSIEPNPEQQIVNLVGEAHAYADMLAYMAKLDSSGALSEARLVNHEIKQDDPDHPVSFAITTDWKIAP